MEFARCTLQSLPRKTLQQLAKSHHLKANGKSSEIISQLLSSSYPCACDDVSCPMKPLDLGDLESQPSNPELRQEIHNNSQQPEMNQTNDMEKQNDIIEQENTPIQPVTVEFTSSPAVISAVISTEIAIEESAKSQNNQIVTALSVNIPEQSMSNSSTDEINVSDSSELITPTAAVPSSPSLSAAARRRTWSKQDLNLFGRLVSPAPRQLQHDLELSPEADAAEVTPEHADSGLMSPRTARQQSVARRTSMMQALEAQFMELEAEVEADRIQYSEKKRWTQGKPTGTAAKERREQPSQPNTESVKRRISVGGNTSAAKAPASALSGAKRVLVASATPFKSSLTSGAKLIAVATPRAPPTPGRFAQMNQENQPPAARRFSTVAPSPMANKAPEQRRFSFASGDKLTAQPFAVGGQTTTSNKLASHHRSIKETKFGSLGALKQQREKQKMNAKEARFAASRDLNLVQPSS